MNTTQQQARTGAGAGRGGDARERRHGDAAGPGGTPRDDRTAVPDVSDARTRRAWVQVARREVVVKLTDRTFLVGTIVTVALIGVVLGIQGYLQNRTNEYDVVATGATATSMTQRVAQGAHAVDRKVVVHPRTVTDAAAARAAVESGKADAWLRQDGAGWALITKDRASEPLGRVAAAVVRDEVLATNARAAGTTVDVLERGTSLATRQLDGDAERSGLVSALGFAFAFLFYLASLMFGMTLAGSVVEEKQSRIVEMIAAAIPLRQLLAGKIVGNTVLAFGQLAVFVGVGLVGMSLTDYGRYVPSLSGSVGWFLGFFVVGFVALSCLWAVAGALASRTEDIQSTSTPITTLMVLMYFGALFLDGTPRVVGSFVPPVSAILMPMRVLEGEAAWWEPVVALVLLVGLAAALILVGERIYRRALLQSGGKLSVRQAWRTEV